MQYGLLHWGRDLLNRNIAKEGLAASKLNRDAVYNRLTATVIQNFFLSS
jgi:hypothetical protein